MIFVRKTFNRKLTGSRNTYTRILIDLDAIRLLRTARTYIEWVSIQIQSYHLVFN